MQGLNAASKDMNFISSMTNYEIVSLVETWTSCKEQFSDLLPGFGCFTVQGHRRGQRGHFNGGISVYVKANLFKNCKRIRCESNIGIYFTIPGNLLNSSDPVLLACVYLPPEGSPFYDEEVNGILLLEDELMSVISEMDVRPYVILAGDLNARTGKLLDYLFDDSCENLPIGDWYDEDFFKRPRSSCDTNEKVNNFGNHLLWLCQSLGIHIVNGRTASDKEGHYTCLTTRGPSVVDYVLLSSELFVCLDDFEVCPEQPTSSVHLPILCTFKAISPSSSGTVEQSQGCHADRLKFTWTADGSEIFKNNLMNAQSFSMLQEVKKCLNGKLINKAVSLFTLVLQNAAASMKVCKAIPVNSSCKQRPTYSVNSRGRQLCQPKWWDSELRNMKAEKNKLLRLFRRSRSEVIMHEYLEANKTFKKNG